jgi:hypothetical protein
MYGEKIIIGNENWKLENTISGYSGWLHTSKAINLPDYGDTPLVYATKFSIKSGKISYFAQYQYGITDFHYQQFRVGISFTVEKLTPKFK